MKVLVTGGAGFIGSNLVHRLMNDDRVTAVKVLDNLETGRFGNISEFKNHKKFEFIEGDIRSYAIALEIYLNDNGTYYGPNGFNGGGYNVWSTLTAPWLRMCPVLPGQP